MTTAILVTIMINSSINGLDPYIVAGLIQTESSFNSKAKGSIGEMGLMQLRPELFGIEPSKNKNVCEMKRKRNLYDPFTNIEVGTRYLAYLKEKCSHKEDDTFVVCFNRGPSGGKKVSNPRQDKYYKKVMANADAFKQKRLFEPKQTLAAN